MWTSSACAEGSPPQDPRSPDVRDVARAAEGSPRQDLRSPDTRDAATRSVRGGAHTRSSGAADDLARLVARARLATAKYATSLRRAKRHGYRTVVTRHIRDMGWHFMNPRLTGFDVTKPPILVYVERGGRWQLVAFEWVFTERPETDPLPGAQYGSFPAACHYADGTFHAAASESDCRRRSPESGARFGFWHPDLVTLHLWLWYPNPDGIYSGTNPLIAPFNATPGADRTESGERPHAGHATARPGSDGTAR